MNDTPQDIKDLQLKIWLSKSPMERLKQMMENNTSLYQFWANTRKVYKDKDENTASVK
jgi:hypothetical protein